MFPVQYELSVVPDISQKIKINNAKMFYAGNEALKEFIRIKGNKIQINQTAQITNNSDLYVTFEVSFKKKCDGKIEFVPKLIH